MLESYSLNATVGANSAIPFNSTSLLKGCTACLTAPTTISLNKCGVYCVTFDGVAGADTTVTLYKNGVAQEQAQSSGTTLSFSTLVQVDKNNSGCPCSSPTNIQVINETAGTFDFAKILVTKLV